MCIQTDLATLDAVLETSIRAPEWTRVRGFIQETIDAHNRMMADNKNLRKYLLAIKAVYRD